MRCICMHAGADAELRYAHMLPRARAQAETVLDFDLVWFLVSGFLFSVFCFCFGGGGAGGAIGWVD